MVIGLFENNRFEENSLTMASTPTAYCRVASPPVNPRRVMPPLGGHFAGGTDTPNATSQTMSCTD